MKMPLLFENTDVNATVWMTIVFVTVWVVVKGVMLLVRRLGRHRWKEWIDAGLDAVDGPLLLGLPAAAVRWLRYLPRAFSKPLSKRFATARPSP